VGALTRKKIIITIMRNAIDRVGANMRAPMKVEKIAVVPQRPPACMRENGSEKRNSPTSPTDPNTVAEAKAINAAISRIIIITAPPLRIYPSRIVLLP
jgi:hypothetical protein